MGKLFRILAVLVPLAAATSAACGPGAARRPDAMPDTAARPDTSEVARMRAKWKASGPRSYRYVYQPVCFCYIRDEMEIVVENGRMTDVRKTDGGEGIPETFWVAFPTVDELFDQIEKARSEGTPVVARYDERLGYPVDVTIGSLAADAGIRHTLRDLEPLRTERELE